MPDRGFFYPVLAQIRDSFRQICSSCAYDDERVRAKILYFVQRRGKLHNPFTNSGGTFSGTIEEIYDGTELPDAGGSVN